MGKVLKETQKKYIRDKIKKSKARWKVLYGHHTFVSIAGHGNADPELDEYLRDLFKEGIDMYMNGHDHNKQIVEVKVGKRKIPVITCGTGGKVYDDELNFSNIEKGSKLVWHAETLGFGTVFCDKNQIRLEMFDENNKLEKSYVIDKKSKKSKKTKKKI